MENQSSADSRCKFIPDFLIAIENLDQ
ncbi:uncharacterized protein METZ01_LOCUS3146 [marine metagenome]|uniref:Uncharacterized protein n=1 Tax=marine metagenome TaxID=408172 RepID=A0A381N6R1_9ZZZZ